MMEDVGGQKVPYEVPERPMIRVGSDVGDDDRQKDCGPEQQQLDPIGAQHVTPGACCETMNDVRHC